MISPELIIDSNNRRLSLYLVEGDETPDVAVKFDGLVLSDYDGGIVARVRLQGGGVLTGTVTPRGAAEEEWADLSWDSDLPSGEHLLEFQLTESSKVWTLPSRYPVLLRVRGSV
ncbi:MAG: hypothetical protein GWN93_19145 [Deltaproteobacteria bacterium]|nr:hypothetical protein [Deltaproteobacteria bacterium]